MKRYDLVRVNTHGGHTSMDEMQPADDGEWVRHDDHVAAMAELAAIVERLRERLEMLRLRVAHSKERSISGLYERLRLAELEEILGVKS